MAANISKVFILDKYFKELQKFWETEKKLQDASSNEAVHLQQRLKSLSTELVTLRNRLHVTSGNSQLPNIPGSNFPAAPGKIHPIIGAQTINSSSNNAKFLGNNSSSVTANNNHSASNNNNQTYKNNKVNSSSNGNANFANKLSNSSKNSSNITTTRNISVPYPLPHHENELKVPDLNHSSATDKKFSTKDIRIRNNEMTSANEARELSPLEMEDLIHLQGPLTEHTVLKTLQARFNESKYFTNIGPILLSINPYKQSNNPLTLSSTRTITIEPQLQKIVQEAVRQQSENGYPQAIILSGASGSGKTLCSMLLLRQLFAVAGGGPETDAFKHLAAAFTVLRSLGSAKTSSNSESSRIGQFIEVQVTDGALYRTKIHCYFLDMTRVIRPLANEKNYHIFYQMLAGLNEDEKKRLFLEGFSIHNLNYLKDGDTHQDEQEDAARFAAWKACLGILGIPFIDVVRVLAAVMLLGNINFIDNQNMEVEIIGENELKSIANLLGISSQALFRGLTERTHTAKNGQLIKSFCDAKLSNMTRDSLAKALYCRTVATIVRRANSLKRLGSGTLSSNSNESVHNQAEVNSQHASTIGGNSGHQKSMVALNNAVRHATDGFIGILDMFGFEEPKMSQGAQLEHLCINLCSETMQHFYNTHIFKTSIDSCREEGIICDTQIDFFDNVPCIDLISSLRTGLLSLLDTECSIRGTSESYVAKMKAQQRNSSRLERTNDESRTFIIRHYAGRVKYDATDFLDTNRDVISDDLVSVFVKLVCNFGFATHLFGTELRALYSQENVPRGMSFRIAPTSLNDLLNGDEPVSTLTQDFHTRLDNLLRTLVNSRPHFIRCIKSNSSERTNVFDKSVVVNQIRALQVLETVNLMASCFPHKIRFKQFISRYRMLYPAISRIAEENSLDDCKAILDSAIEQPFSDTPMSLNLSWAPGKRHVFLSEGLRQHLENSRTCVRNRSAIMIQSVWRGWRIRRISVFKRYKKDMNFSPKNALMTQSMRESSRNVNNNKSKNMGTLPMTRPRPITSDMDLESDLTKGRLGYHNNNQTELTDKCDVRIINQTCNLFGLDLENPPRIPPSRSYTITGNSKLGYPQIRRMKMTFPEDINSTRAEDQMKKGEVVKVVGASPRRGHLLVESANGTMHHVPFQFLELINGSPAISPHQLQL